MVANPIQRKQRNSMLGGLAIGLIIGLIACIIVYLFLSGSGATVGSGEGTKTVAVLNKAIRSGQVITSADYTLQKVNASVAPTDVMQPSDNTIAKIDLSAGTILSGNMMTTQNEALTKDLRMQEYNMIVLPTDLIASDYIDVRLQLPDGSDYIVVSKKKVQKTNASTVWLKMNEEEILVMSNAIVEYYIMAGSKLYATKYTDAGGQDAATPTYVPNSTVVDLINSELKTGNIKELVSGRYTDALKALRNNKIRTTLAQYADSSLENLETNLQEEIKTLKESREAYFGALNSAK